MKNLFIFSLLIFLSACPLLHRGYKYNSGELPTTPQNMEDFNSTYNDYNSTAPTLGTYFFLAFSTDRYHGIQYDIRLFPMSIVFSKSTGELAVRDEFGGYNYVYEDFYAVKNVLYRINTQGNELGPNIIYPYQYAYFSADYRFVMMYATDEQGDFDIRYIYADDSTEADENYPVHYLNTEYDELYPCLDIYQKTLYFCSNRNGDDFNIYMADLMSAGSSLINRLADSSDVKIDALEILNSVHDDKCPFILDDIMVFASNRDGGFGGFDLYYSRLNGNDWSEPVNLGDKINTSDNEYRPILIQEGIDPDRNMMIFSSDRPGGLGGFDLYWVGVSL